MNIDDYQNLDGLGMAELLEQGETTSDALTRCAIELAEAWNPTLNAITYPRYEESLAIAETWQPRGAFRGIPFLLKDSGFAHRRFPSSIGSRLFDDTTYPFDATVAGRFEEAGLIPFARSTVSELCMGASTEARRNGAPTRNPWDLGRSVGGSSGGAAAAVAARIVPVAHGSDGGGSIRIPAACCGVYGLKPSRGRVPMGPARGEGWGGMASDGVLSVTVRDTAAAMDHISGYEPGAPYAAPPQTESYLEVVRLATRQLDGAARMPLRIGILREGWNGIGIVPECDAAVTHTARLLTSLGHDVTDAKLPTLDYSGFVLAHGNILATNVALAVDTRLKAVGRALRDDDIEPVLAKAYVIGKSLDAATYVDAVQRLHAIGRAFATTMRDYDLLLTPTLTTLPAELGFLALDVDLPFRDFRERAAHYATFLAVINAAGLPAASLPLSWTDAGLPVATQLIGHFGREDMVLALSAQLEALAPWSHRKPTLART
ncbi:amidase [Cupriavidus pampae]|uniref:6-aminohexanoate-cyclic-dimer hydrolase n=1 Tax=Cupriavidus pampae TaxID=659251 RepID=A0ABM8XB14_9BURK|nr:amidase [Cupriavidus pampae]CAG9177210.1 6-aminohexanoate-cyclic-dimer hydrolase [Cupriavidus pampae]